MNKKIKILVVPSDRTGVSFYRSTKPHLHLESMFPNEFHVDINYEPQLDNDEWLKQYDIIHYHRTIGPYEKVNELVEKFKKLGIVSIMDLDDYWAPGTHHPAHSIIKYNNLDKKIVNNLKSAEYVTTTTDIFANEIKKFNKNTSVFPNGIDPTEKQFAPNPEKSDRIRIGWLGGSCYDDKTEILTDSGWKLFNELDKTEKVATLNPKTNKIEYQKPISYINEPYKGKLNVGKNGLIDYAVTPNHNMYVSKVKSLTHKKLDYELIESKNVHGQNLHFKRDGIWKKEDIEYFDVTNEFNEETIRFEMDDWLKFFGFWLADGWTSNINYGYQTGICQFKDNDYLTHINEIMIKYVNKPYINKNDGGQYRYSNKNLWGYLSKFGKANEKFIPRNLLDNLSTRQLNILFDWYIKGDGNIDKNGRIRGWTVSKQLSDDLQELALKIGVAATITNRGKRGGILCDGREIKPNYDLFQVNFSKHPSISKHNKLTPLLRAEDQFQVEYNSTIHCVEVPNHTLYVRRNGKAFWCGNSHLKDLELLKGVVGKLKNDGLIDRVQFVLCGFDTRGKITMIDEKTGQRKQRNIEPKESVWFKYENIFTNDYDIVSSEYKEHLLRFTKDEFYDIDNEPYRRVWTKPINTYASNYNLFDISLAPLVENKFNKMKSQLKVIEAGFHKKAIIAQNFGPYQIDLTSAYEKGKTKKELPKFNESANSYLVETRKNNKDWYKYIKTLILEPEKIKILSDNLHESIKNVYSLDTITTNRAKFYKTIVGKKKK